jgi:hypothetical protein
LLLVRSDELEMSGAGDAMLLACQKWVRTKNKALVTGRIEQVSRRLGG